ncbi:hypothetical protein DY000_02012003 [Brassica cretica]|uniref:Aminotransferase class V domain-containing protein n=1 Tax=Brassica cretica TaxID=69181 RepID=A0ABQ7D3F0_BRACR|nr:hypothetical protein DY000_02012003 [Brassica cretica]
MSASTNSLLLGNQTQIPSFKPKPISQYLLHLTKPSTRTKPLSIRCAASTTERVINFAAGPAALPENVLLKAQSELYNWRGSGMSVMEMSHRRIERE